jgi:hypothetical protein
MDIKEYGNFYHVDISTQIDNNWKDDTALGIVKDSRRYSVKIKGSDKEIIKRRFISRENSRSAKRHNRRVIILVYCYLLYKALSEFLEAKSILLCRDVRPELLVINYLRKISSVFDNPQILDREIKFRKREDRRDKKLPKSLAGKYVTKVYRGQIKPDKILNNTEIKELIDIIGKEI